MFQIPAIFWLPPEHVPVLQQVFRSSAFRERLWRGSSRISAQAIGSTPHVPSATPYYMNQPMDSQFFERIFHDLIADRVAIPLKLA
jgi:hypothetical protein